MVLVNADKINKSYTEKPLLQDISLSIHEGEKIGLIGVNGTGKSTLLRIIAKAEDPDSGKIVYTNNIKIAYLPQHPAFDAGLSVGEQAEKYLSVIDPDTPDFTCRSMMTKLGIRDFDSKMEDSLRRTAKESRYGGRTLGGCRPAHFRRADQPHG